MAIFINRVEKKFTQIPNSAIIDMRMDAAVFRLYCYIYSKPGTWQINNNDIKKRLNIKTDHALAKYWKILLDIGLIKRYKSRNQSGKFSGYDYELLPYVAQPHAVEPNTVKDHDGLTHIHSNTDSFSNTDKLSNTNSNSETSENEDFSKEEIDNEALLKKQKKERKKKVPLKKKEEWDQDVLNCYDSTLKLFPEHLRPNTDKKEYQWIDCIDKLKRIDGVPLKVVYRIVKSVREDDFWSRNFESLLKLRRKNPDGNKYIVVFSEKFKEKTTKIGRQTLDEIQSNYERMFKAFSE